MTREASTVTLGPFDARRDLDRLREWLAAPHVSRFWGDAEPNVATVRRRDPRSHALILADGEPVGYVCWQKPSSRELQDAGLADLPAGLVDIDMLIGDPLYLGRGIGPRALRLLFERLARTGVLVAGLGTSAENRAAIRAYEKARLQAVS